MKSLGLFLFFSLSTFSLPTKRKHEENEMLSLDSGTLAGHVELTAGQTDAKDPTS